MKHYNVLIATPGDSMLNSYVKSLFDTLAILVKKKISHLWINRASSHVSLAREATTMNNNFMDVTKNAPLLGEVTYDKIIWIDSDISWTPEDFLKIYNSELDIVSGVYLNNEYRPMFSVKNQENMKDLLALEQPFEVDKVGFGFVGIKQGVFESIPRPWFGTEYIKHTQDGKEYLIPFGEDYSFCVKAKKAGYQVYVDPTVKVGHHKIKEFSVPPQKPDS